MDVWWGLMYAYVVFHGLTGLLVFLLILLNDEIWEALERQRFGRFYENETEQQTQTVRNNYCRVSQKVSPPRQLNSRGRSDGGECPKLQPEPEAEGAFRDR